MKFAAVLALIGFAAAQNKTIDEEFAQYVAKHNKHYLTEEEYAARRNIFAQTHFIINEHNMSNASHTLAHNIMSDWTVQEKEALLGRKRSNKHENTIEIASQPFEGKLSNFNWQSELKSMQRIKN